MERGRVNQPRHGGSARAEETREEIRDDTRRYPPPSLRRKTPAARFPRWTSTAAGTVVRAGGFSRRPKLSRAKRRRPSQAITVNKIAYVPTVSRGGLLRLLIPLYILWRAKKKK